MTHIVVVTQKAKDDLRHYYSVAAEHEPIYQFFYGQRSGRYRALFTVEGDRVLALHVRRGTMDKATERDVFG